MTTTKKMTKAELAAALAKAMNLLNGVDRDEWNYRDLGDFHELAALMPESADFANNGTVRTKDLL